MKKLIFTLFALMMIFSLSATASAYKNEEWYKGSEGTTINVFNWGEYISDTYEDGLIDVNAEFEKLTGINVNYVTYESNEDLYPKIKNGGASYDIIVPSDYMIARMISEDMLQKIDISEHEIILLSRYCSYRPLGEGPAICMQITCP